jgi:MAGUK p55 subfamily member 3/7
MLAHDSIAQKDFYPHLPDIPVEMDEDEETIKIVQLVKSNEPLVSRQNFFILFAMTISIALLRLRVLSVHKIKINER